MIRIIPNQFKMVSLPPNQLSATLLDDFTSRLYLHEYLNYEFILVDRRNLPTQLVEWIFDLSRGNW